MKIVLVVDNDRVFLVGVRDFLMHQGYHVLVASDGGKALVLIEKFALELSLALVDIAMPVVGGYELITALRRHNGNLPILAMTNSPNDYHLEIARRMGAAGTLRKPPAGDEAAQSEWQQQLAAYL